MGKFWDYIMGLLMGILWDYYGIWSSYGHIAGLLVGLLMGLLMGLLWDIMMVIMGYDQLFWTYIILYHGNMMEIEKPSMFGNIMGIFNGNRLGFTGNTAQIRPVGKMIYIHNGLSTSVSMLKRRVHKKLLGVLGIIRTHNRNIY